ncbi:ALF repeat-containing protein [Lentzea sp. NPDC051838]|uniref:ALF repeat-containing protein n=1 Tax=Lentzea sp. NPDC051838 TaxID=3154849 RepID=UPI00342E74E0
MRVQTRGFRMSRASLVLATVLGLAISTVSPVAPVAGAAEPSERARTLALTRTGGDLVVKAANAALVGTDEQVHRFLSQDLPVIAEHDDRIRLTRMMATSGTAVRNAANTAMGGSVEDVRAFLNEGWKEPWRNDQYQLVNKIIARGGPKVQAAGQAALKGTFEDVKKFLGTGQYAAAEHDDRIRVNKILAATADGSNVYVAAQRALDGTIDDVREFLRSGWQVAAQRDQETMTVAALAELAAAEQQRAAEQNDIAKEASDQAVAAAEKAKAAAEKAAAEALAARNDATKAAQAASRAAAAAQGAAAAAQSAIDAAGRANSAARVAANAAGQAAIAASMTERAAGQAHDAASAAASDATKAHDARVAAEKARDNAKSADSAANAADAAGKAVEQAGIASGAANSATKNADLAAKAAEDAAASARAAGANAQEAEQAAARARAAAAEARRASERSQTLAGQAATAAYESRDAARSAATHARAAADFADEAANHAGEAEKAAERSATAAAEADKAAKAAKAAADKAHQVAQTARDSEAERIKQAESQGVRDAQDAVVEERNNRDKITWTAGRREAFDTETERLLTEARNGNDTTKLSLGRQVAVRLLTRGGPWVVAAAETALEGDEWAVKSFLGTNLTRAVEQDDRSSVGIVARTTTVAAQRETAVAAQYGNYDGIKEYLRTKAYPGKRDTDRQEVNRVMAAAGSDSVVYAKGNEALNAELAGNANALHEFLETGRFAAALHDDRKAVNKAYDTGDLEVKAAAQAALSGPDSYLRKFLTTGLPKAQLADADRLKHEASIDSYLAKADQSAELARENAEKAAEWAAIARKAADEAKQWRDKAEASKAAAAESAREAQSYADAAQRSADQAAASAKRARDAAAQAGRSANEATASAANAAASATYANTKAGEAKASADAARASAIQAGKDAVAAQAAADEAQGIAEDWAKRADANQNTPDPQAEKDLSPFGMESVPENVRDDPREVSGLSCKTPLAVWTAVHTTCTWKVEHHITGTLRWFTFQCPAGATGKDQCTRVEVGTSPIDMRFVKEYTTDSAVIGSEGLKALAKSTIDDLYKCAFADNMGEQLEGCAWSVGIFLLPAVIGRYAKIIALNAKYLRKTDDFGIFLDDGSEFLANIRADGSLDLAMKVTVKKQGIGSWMVNSAMDHFAGRVTAINGKWGRGVDEDMVDNLDAFNNALKAGKSMDDAARLTPTGKMAAKYGFTQPKIDQKALRGEFGNYTNVEVRFGTP